MEAKLIIDGMIKGLEMLGVTIDKITENTVYLSIPKYPKSDKNTTPEQIVKTTQEVFDRLSKADNKITVKYKIIEGEPND